MIDEKKELPEGWRWVKLADVCEIARGGSPRPIDNYITKDKDGINWIRIGDATNSKYISETAEKITKEGAKKSRFVKKGDFILSNSMSFGRPYIMDTEGCIHDGWLLIRDYKDSFDKEFLYFSLCTEFVKEQFIKLARGGIVNNLNINLVKEVIIPIPPLSEQKRIASILQERMAAVEKARKAAEERLSAIKALPSACLRQVFPQPDQELPEGWKCLKLEKISHHIQYGFTASADFVIVDSHKFLRITDIQDNKVNWDSVPCCKTEEPLDDYCLNDGDIVFARTGATTGKSYLIEQPPKAIFASYLIRIKLTEDANPNYLYHFFQSDIYWNQIKSGIRGGAQGGFNATMLSNLDIPLPVISEQQRIIAILNEKMTAIEHARKAAEEELTAINALPAAILRQAFNGEL